MKGADVVSLEIFGRFVDALDDLLDRRELDRLEAEDETEDETEEDPQSPFVREGGSEDGVVQVAQLSSKQLKEEQRKSDKKLAQQQVQSVARYDLWMRVCSRACLQWCLGLHRYKCSGDSMLRVVL